MRQKFFKGFEKRAMEKDAIDIVGGLRKGFGAASSWLKGSGAGQWAGKQMNAIRQSGFGKGVADMGRDISNSKAGKWAGGQLRQAAGVVRRNPGKAIAGTAAATYGATKLFGGNSQPQNPSQQQSVNLYGGRPY